MGWSEKSSLVAATLLGLTLAAPASGEPIPPQPLWKQIANADAIVVADVDSSEHLHVKEVWKGEAAGVLEVEAHKGMVCPAPGVLLPGETVLAFLSRSEHWFGSPPDGRWYVTGLSYGTVYPDAADLEHYRTLVAKALVLQQRGRVTDEDRITWLLEAVSHPATRWDGLMGLAEVGRRDSASRRSQRIAPLSALLTPEQRASLARSFSEAPGEAGEVALLLPTVVGVRDARFEAAVVGVLDREVADAYGYGLMDALGPVASWAGMTAPALPDRLWYMTNEARREAIHDAWFDLRTRILTRGSR